MFILAFFAFLSGIVTILSPCILPVLPIILSGSIGGKSKPLGVVTGFIISFSLFTLVLSTLVQLLAIPPDALRGAAVVIIILFGLVLFIPPLQLKFEVLASKMVRRKQGSGKQGFGGGVLVGGSLGLLWTPCVGPIMASVISLAVSRQVDGGAVVIILSYAAGTSLPMFGVMLGGRKLLSRFPRLVAATGRIQRVFGIVMIIAGLSVGFGLDRRFQTMILTAFPNYGTGLTSFENSDFIRRALDRRIGEPLPISLEDSPRNGRLGDYGKAPEISAEGPWFNVDSPLTMDDLKGKVVLVDFWTYSCVNCVRTIPYLRSWQENYGDKGLVILGVHSPEFAFERDAGNVQTAMADLGVTWPVVLDNSFAQWRAYRNRYWPAHYFIDAEGNIRYFHFGEGEYDNGEKVIRTLLKEAGYTLDKEIVDDQWEHSGGRTPETYLGYERARGFLSEDRRINDAAVLYSLDETPENGEWNLGGEWIIRDDFVEVDGKGTLELGFHAQEVFLVIEPRSEDAVIEVLIDDVAAADSNDVVRGVLRPVESRMYKLIGLEESGEHILKLVTEGNVRFYAFTFG